MGALLKECKSCAFAFFSRTHAPGETQHWLLIVLLRFSTVNRD